MWLLPIKHSYLFRAPAGRSGLAGWPVRRPGRAGRSAVSQGSDAPAGPAKPAEPAGQLAGRPSPRLRPAGPAVPAGLPRGVADARRLAQVLLNLVGNAIKFTDEGKIVISAARAGENFEISVIDTGPGIAPEIADNLFAPFMTTKRDGMGVGLSISRTIIEAHGGRLWVEPTPGGGATFKFTLKLVEGDIDLE